MSFSGSTQIPKGSSADDAKSVLDVMSITGNDDCPVERSVAITFAKDAVHSLLQSGAIGAVEGSGWNVSISGHVNPHNLPREGWSSDSLSINLSQIKE